jgi:hypothetical protein
MNLDFIDFSRNDSNYHWNKYFNYNSYVWNAMDIDTNRVYIGLQTLRYEMYKLHNWIYNNADFIMKLNLAAWYGHGHTNIKLGNFKLGFDDNKIDEFIDINNIYTRPLIRRVYESEQSSGIDSGFYDITILKHKDFELDSVFCMTVINRRTDPLIFDSSNNKFYFISTHEFEVLTTGDNDKANPITREIKTSAYWREMYWKKQGCREIKILMGPKIITKPEFSYQIDEIFDNELLAKSNPNWAESEKINNRISNKNILQGNFINLKMLPGEGRMFKITKKNIVVDSINNGINLNIKPNPANEYIEIEFTTQKYKNTEIAIYSIDGKLIDIIRNPSINTIIYNTRKLAIGEYNIVLVIGKEKAMQKFVIAR